MGLFNRILCPIDLSDHSRHALEYAVGIGRHYGASLTTLYVIPPPVPAVPTFDSPAYPGYVYTPEDLDAIEREVRNFVDSGHSGMSIESRVVQGFAVGQILDVAASMAADLIVVGTHGRGGFQRLVLGSVAERVIARVSLPVMAIPPHMPDVAPVGPAPFANILCGIDYTPSSQKALDYATLLARESAGQLTLVHVVEIPTDEPALATGIRGVVEEGVFVTAARGRLHAVLPDEVFHRHAGQVVVKTGKPYRGILDVAERQHCDLIVLGAHGNLANVLGVGSTTNHVLRDATCPVLTVRA
jgi:nucleotide-binding universal stress UspA family protein